jgi:hemerythrin-like domain-containing protein
MSYPIHTLKHEHRIIEQGLRALDGICLRFSSGEQVPPEALAQLLDFVRTFADGFHHGKEEKYFFPILERQGIARKGGPLEIMEREHELERELLAELGNDVKAYQAGIPDSCWRFVETASRFIELLTGHIQREDQILFRIAEEVLDDTDKAALSAAFKQAEDEIGADVLEKCERIAAELERAWAA